MKFIIKKSKEKFILLLFIFFSLLFLTNSFLLFTLLPINERSIDTLKTLLIPSQENLSEFSDKYSISKTPSNLKLKVESKEEAREIPYKKETLIDSDYLKDYSYTLPGKNGNIKVKYFLYNYEWLFINQNHSVLKDIIQTKPIAEKTFTGNKDFEEISILIKDNFQKFLNDVKNDNSVLSKDLFDKFDEFTLEDKRKLENVEVRKITFEKDIIKKDDNLVVGTLEIHLDNCNLDIKENILYDFENKIWKFEDSNILIKKLCIPQFTRVGDQYIGTCIDCIYFPVNKVYGLRSDYAPRLTSSDIYPNVHVDTRVYPDLKEMFEAATSAGHSVRVNSSFRSYGTQVDTFEGWVKNEMSKGKDRASAEAIANTYSARPGFSEHQLGTALDIVTKECTSFGFGCAPTEALWSWLRDNAYKYGFALSYPKGMESRTGYTYEPWHWRWINRDLAAEYKKIEDTTTLQEFLLSKNLY